VAAAASLPLHFSAAAATAPSLSWTASSAPFALSFDAEGTPLFAEATTSGGPGGRLSYRLADGSFHGLTRLLSTSRSAQSATYRVATDEEARTALVSVRRTSTGLRVSFTLQPDTDVTTTFEAFATHEGEHFLGGGERPGTLDLSGQAFAVKAAYSCQNTAPAPFFISSTGYGISLKSTSIASFGFPGATAGSACAGGAEARCPLADGLQLVQLCTKTPSLAYDVFGGTPADVVSAYATTVGRPELPPISQFALIKWRDTVSGPEQLFEDVDRLHALSIPIGWVLLDNPWEADACYGSMSFDAKFGDPRGLIGSLHRRGVKLMLWISPLVRAQSCPPSPLYPPPALFGSGGSAVTIDLTDPAARATFESRVRALLDLGVDGFKGDRGDEVDLEPVQLAGGLGAALHNAYPLLYERAVAQAIEDSGRAGEVATIFRSGAPGSAAAVPGFWAGDEEGSFFGLRQAVHQALSGGIAGYSTWGSDTGGYTPTQSAEVFVRWAQLSSVSPVFEVGGIGRNATFWQLGTSAVHLLRDAAVLHYELFPYLYELAREAHTTGLPILRPLALLYPADPEAWGHDLELLVGRDLLAAPVTEPGPAGKVDSPVYLPSGTWVDLVRGTTLRGARRFSRPTPIEELPLYLRAGAAVPFAARTPLIWPKPWPTNALQLAGRGGWLYAPGGATSVQNADFGSFRAITDNGVARLTLSRAPKQTQILVAGTTPKTLAIDGAAVPPARSIAALRRAASGWAFVQKPFPGIVVKLAPHGGSATVRLLLR
jgi:alpha-glucosidase (family GH31 glycosyl hydrolase)